MRIAIAARSLTVGGVEGAAPESDAALIAAWLIDTNAPAGAPPLTPDAVAEFGRQLGVQRQ